MKYHVLISLKKTMKKYLQMSSAAVVIGALRVNKEENHFLLLLCCLGFAIMCCLDFATIHYDIFHNYRK